MVEKNFWGCFCIYTSVESFVFIQPGRVFFFPFLVKCLHATPAILKRKITGRRAPVCYFIFYYYKDMPVNGRVCPFCVHFFFSKSSNLLCIVTLAAIYARLTFSCFPNSFLPPFLKVNSSGPRCDPFLIHFQVGHHCI